MFRIEFIKIKHLHIFILTVLVFLINTNALENKKDSLFLYDFNKAKKNLWVSEISAITSVIILSCSGVALFESYGSNSDAIIISQDKRVAWSLFTFGVLSEGFAIFGITTGIKHIKRIKENFDIEFCTNEMGLKYKILFLNI